MRILRNCFDSHVHWRATGEFAHRLDLKFLREPSDVSSLQIEPHHFRGEWLVGWGWDQNNWSPAQFPHHADLDSVFSKFPVAFFRADGHALWLNQMALQKITPAQFAKYQNSNGGRFEIGSNGQPTGVLIDNAMSIIKDQIPEASPEMVSQDLQEGMGIFNRNGFTHIRDLSCSETQWNEAVRLEQRNALTLAVEQYFDADPIDHIDRALGLAKQARREKSRLLRVQGIKVYFDGALGSEGALLSHPYRSGKTGLRLMTIQQFEDVAKRTWDEKFDLAVHVIGDQAAHEVARAACSLWDQGAKGRLHLEHAEMMRDETIQLLKGRNVICHMQPCHWLTDKKWLREKVGDLMTYVFPWSSFQNLGIAFDFGSDSPIEAPVLGATLESLIDSCRGGIPGLAGDPLKYHEHLDMNWTPDTYTEVDGAQIRTVVFNGRKLSI